MRPFFFSLALTSLPLFAACGGTTIATNGAPASDAGEDTGPAVACTAPLASCGGVCVSTLTDENNCGACGIRCGADGFCSDAQCVSTLPDGSAPTGPGLPPNPGGPTPPPASDVTLAMHTVYLGDTSRAGVASMTAWQGFGLNLDGKETTAASRDVCELYSGAAQSTQIDGTDGIDNSFGANILPILLTIAGSYSQTINAALARGQLGSTIFSLGALGTASNAYPLVGAALRADALMPAPAWNGSDVWPIDSSSVTGGSTDNPIASFAASYMNGRVWVSGPSNTPSILSLPFFFLAAQAKARDLQIVMTVADDNSGATNGTLAGLLDTEDFIASIQVVAGTISTSLCSAAAFASIATQIRQASDIMSDGTNVPGLTCNAISFGIGFDATAAQLGAVVTPTPPVSPCN